ncbi:MAG: Lrp/AsnC family transcriptional regulator [Methanosarcinales archaeon]|nr:Lrp/AsnC family transcriptional regulator [Methanosarcinales archaeon]
MSEGIGVGPRLTELAKAIGVPRSTANLRVRMLTEKGIIIGYHPEINWEELGYYINGYMGIECPKSVVSDMINFLKDQEWVFGIWEVTTGKYGLLVMCRFKQYSEIEQLQTFTKTIQGVRDADVFLLGSYHPLK